MRDQKGLLVSSCMETLRQEPGNIGEELQQYYTRCNVIGDSKERWATEDLVAADKLTAPVRKSVNPSGNRRKIGVLSLKSPE